MSISSSPQRRRSPAKSDGARGFRPCAWGPPHGETRHQARGCAEMPAHPTHQDQEPSASSHPHFLTTSSSPTIGMASSPCSAITQVDDVKVAGQLRGKAQLRKR
eukprot:6963029-Pyramimonas_sp.AAC.1